MTPLMWTIALSAGAIVLTLVIMASEIEKRLDRIATILMRANEMTQENRTGERRDH